MSQDQPLQITKLYGPEKLQDRRGYDIIQARSPFTGLEWDAYVSHTLQNHVARRGMGVSRELAFVVKSQILQPVRVFRGIRDLEHDVVEDNWICYCCRPTFAYDYVTHDKICPPWEGEVMLVYMTDERVLYNWYWVDCLGTDPDLPVDFESRFLVPIL